jgi:hypothetical protein
MHLLKNDELEYTHGKLLVRYQSPGDLKPEVYATREISLQ